jgi:hypothetical protein
MLALFRYVHEGFASAISDLSSSEFFEEALRFPNGGFEFDGSIAVGGGSVKGIPVTALARAMEPVWVLMEAV